MGSHSEKEGAAGTYKGGYGFHPLMAYGDQTGEALAASLRLSVSPACERRPSVRRRHDFAAS